jgi:hypothetical protein
LWYKDTSYATHDKKTTVDSWRGRSARLRRLGLGFLKQRVHVLLTTRTWIATALDLDNKDEEIVILTLGTVAPSNSSRARLGCRILAMIRHAPLTDPVEISDCTDCLADMELLITKETFKPN